MWFVGLMTNNVNVTTAPIRIPATSHHVPALNNQAAREASEATMAKGALRESRLRVTDRPLGQGRTDVPPHPRWMLGDIDVERSAGEEGCRQGGDKLKKLKHRCILICSRARGRSRL